MPMRALVIVGLAVMLAGITACATQPPSEDPVLIKLTEIDERLSKVEKTVNNDSLVQLAGQVAELQQEVRELRGQVETLGYEAEGAANRQRDQYLDIDQRLQSLESGSMTASPGGRPGQTASRAAAAGGGAAAAASQATNGGDSERDRYQQAFDLLKDGRYDQARAAFKQFLADFPGSDLAGHSQYWLAETYYVTQQYKEALPAFQKVISDYPQSRKLPDALLKVGYCHYELGQYDTARSDLTRVVQDYPESTAARLAGQRLDRMKSEGH